MRRLISKFDLFSALPTLRADKEPQVSNLWGGLFSIMVFTCFAYIFFNSMVNMVQLQQISATQITNNDRPPDQGISNITIGLGLFTVANAFNYSILNLRHIFQLSAFTVDRDYNLTPIKVFPCQRSMWDKFDDKTYHTLNLDNHLCIQKENVTIFGQFGTPQVSFIFFTLTRCNPLTSPVKCANTSVVKEFFAKNMFWNRFIPCSVVIMNTGISPTKQYPYTYQAYEQTLFLVFNEDQTLFVQTFLGTYQVTTDASFMPWKAQQIQRGYYVNQCILTTIVNYLKLPLYVNFYVFPSPANRVINRTYGKFDTVLSYVGGLYGIVISFLSVFILSFNQYKYELRVGEGAFTFQDGHLAKEEDLNFFKYLKYVFYDWVKKLCCVSLNWKDCRAIQAARHQAIQQIDIKHLLKRISHLQKINDQFVEKDNEILMYMAESSSISDVKNTRNVVQYCHKLSGGENCPTIQTFDQIDAVFKFGMTQFLNTQLQLGASRHPKDKRIRISLAKQNRNNQKLKNSSIHNKKTSLQVMEEYVKKYIVRYGIHQKTFELTKQELQTQDKLAEAFYGADQETRSKIIRKIPLSILFRMYLQKENKLKEKQQEIIIQYKGKAKQNKQPQKKNNSSYFSEIENVLALAD